MAYVLGNPKTKKQLKEWVADGRLVVVFQPGPFGPHVDDGVCTLEGPHYPESARRQCIDARCRRTLLHSESQGAAPGSAVLCLLPTEGCCSDRPVQVRYCGSGCDTRARS